MMDLRQRSASLGSMALFFMSLSSVAAIFLSPESPSGANIFTASVW
jgi:hypothetical protein